MSSRSRSYSLHSSGQQRVHARGLSRAGAGQSHARARMRLAVARRTSSHMAGDWTTGHGLTISVWTRWSRPRARDWRLVARIPIETLWRNGLVHLASPAPQVPGRRRDRVRSWMVEEGRRGAVRDTADWSRFLAEVVMRGQPRCDACGRCARRQSRATHADRFPKAEGGADQLKARAWENL
jgi:hypothetical protein